MLGSGLYVITYYVRRVQPTRCNVSQFISVRHSKCSRRFFRPSSRAQNWLGWNFNSIQERLAAGSSIGVTNAWRCTCSFVLLMMDEKNRVKHLERLTEINKFWKVASCCLCSANILAMHGLMNVKHITSFKIVHCCYFKLYNSIRFHSNALFEWSN